MISRAAVILIVGLACIMLAGSCQERQVSAADVALVLDSLEHKLEWLDYRLALEGWRHHTEGYSDSNWFYSRLYNHVVSNSRDFNILEKAKPYLTDEIDQRRYELLFGAVLLGRVESRPDIEHLRDSLSALEIAYRAEFEGEPRHANFLYATYTSDRNRVRREMAYRAWRAIGHESADGLQSLIRLRNQQAGREGYNNYLAATFKTQGIDSGEYLDLLHRLDSLSSEHYRTILQAVRRKLSLSQLEIWDIAFGYADVNREVDRYFPVDSQLTFVKRSLMALGYDLDKLPIYLDLESRPDKSQFAYAFAVKPPHDIRVLANLSGSLYSTRVLMYEIGHALHSSHVSESCAPFVRLIDGSWSEGVAQTFAALCEDSTWLQKYAHLSPELISRYLKARREQEIISLRLMLTRLMFEYQAYTNSNVDLNKIYWDLFEQYMLLPRHDEIKPWAAVSHYITHPVYLQNYLFGNVVATQTVAYREKTYGGFTDRNTSGSFLTQNYLRFGSRYRWRELLLRGTGEDLNPQYLVSRLGM